MTAPGRKPVNAALLIVAVLCGLVAVLGVLMVLGKGTGWDALGLAIAGFFGSGAVVLGRQALGFGK